MRDTRKEPGSLVVVAVEGASESAIDAARVCAEKLGLPIGSAAGPGDAERSLILFASDAGLELREAASKRARPVRVDFVGGATGFRRVSGLRRDQLIGRAMGLKSGPKTIVDATAGLCRDAFLLACLGCQVTAIERSPVLLAMIRDGLARARRANLPKLSAALDRMELIAGDARNELRKRQGQTASRPEVVYLDPMYTPDARRSALANRTVRTLRQLVGDDRDAPELLAVARETAAHRTVVKRHRHAPPLGHAPDVQYKGRAVRYDVYLKAN